MLIHVVYFSRFLYVNVLFFRDITFIRSAHAMGLVPVLRVRMFLVVGIVCSLIRTQGCRNTTRLFNPDKRSNSIQDFTTSTR